MEALAKVGLVIQLINLVIWLPFSGSQPTCHPLPPPFEAQINPPLALRECSVALSAPTSNGTQGTCPTSFTLDTPRLECLPLYAPTPGSW